MMHSKLIISIILINFQLNYAQRCGVKPPENRISNGVIANQGDIPWQARIRYGFLGKPPITCSGSLLNRRWVITSAQCIHARNGFLYDVILGDSRLNEYDGTEQSPFGVERIVVHPEYRGPPAVQRSTDLRNDLALLRLNRDVLFNNYVTPVCLPDAGTDLIGQIGIVSGWGSIARGSPPTNQLRKVNLQVLSNADCQELTNSDVSDKMICGYDIGKSICDYDLGDPYSYKLSNNTWTLIGVASNTRSPCGTTPTVFTRVAKYIDYIISIVKS